MKLGSNTKTLVLAIIFNLFVVSGVPVLLLYGLFDMLAEYADALTTEQLNMWLSTATVAVCVFVRVILLVLSILWASKWFTFETVPLAKKRWAHVVWVVALCIISGLAGFTVWSSILS